MSRTTTTETTTATQSLRAQALPGDGGGDPAPEPTPAWVDFADGTAVAATAGQSVTVTGHSGGSSTFPVESITGVTVYASSGESWTAQQVSGSWQSWTCAIRPTRPGDWTLSLTATTHSTYGDDSVDGSTTKSLKVADPGVTMTLQSPASTGSLTYHARVGASSPIGVLGVRASGDGGATYTNLQLVNGSWVGDVPMAIANPVGATGRSVTLRLQGYDVAMSTSFPPRTSDVTITAVDVTPPGVSWLAPADDGFVVEVLPADAAGATVAVRVRLDDTSGGVVAAGFAAYTSDVSRNPVVCASSPGQTVALAPVANEPGTWQGVVPVPGLGQHTLAVTCRDLAGLSTVVTRTVVVRGSEISGTSEQDYLADLVDFVGRRLVTPAGQPVGPRDLAAALHQPFVAVAHAPSRLTQAPLSAVRGAVQVLRDYLSPQPGPAAASWPLNEGAGTVARDTSGGADGRLTSVTWSPGPTPSTQAATFDGVASYVDVGAAPNLAVSTQLTLCAWVKPTGAGGANGAVIVGREGAFLLARFADGTLRWALATTSPGWAWTSTGVTIPIGAWSHVALSYDGSGVRLLVNGVPMNRIAASGVVTPAGTQRDVRIGCRQADPAGTHFAGAISDVRVYDRALGEYDVKALAGRVPDGDQVWLDDDFPAGTQADPGSNESWTWTTASPTPFSGTKCHASPTRAGMHQHFFTSRTDGFPLSPGDVVFTYVYLDPANPPKELMLQFDEFGLSGWEHRAFWADDPTGSLLPWGTAGTASRRYMGPLPATGRWVRLEVPAAAVGLERKAIGRVAYTVYDGQAWWDRTGVTSARRAVAGSGYPQAAYGALLTALGTSLDELRAARGADPATRSRLADRMGFTLSRTRPDELDRMLLTAGQVTEADLQNLFGMRPTDGDPLAVPAAVPQLTSWRLAAARSAWAVQDWSAGPDSPPVVDPDLVGATDLVNPGGPVAQLRTSRAGWLDTQLAQLRGLVQSTATDAANLSAVVAAVLPGFSLTAVAAQRDAGADVSATLAAVQLTPPAFDRLVTLTRLAATGALQPDEWTEALAIAVQVRKARTYPQWRQAEQAAEVLLDPALFRTDGVAPAGVSPWRASPQARVAWQERLLSRVEQLSTLDASLADAVASAEREALPVLRDVALAAASAGLGSGATLGGAPVPDALSGRLGADLQVGPMVTTTQLDQAVEALQALLAAVDAGGALTALGLPWRLKNGLSMDTFAGERAWMTTYASWSSAMNLFFYPESHLVPAARPRQGNTGEEMSAAFAALVDGLADPLPDSATGAGGYTSAREALATFVTAVQSQASGLLAALAPAHYPPPTVPTGSWPTAADLLTASQLEAYRVAQNGWFFPSGQPARYSSFLAVPNWAKELLLEVPLQLASRLAQGRQWEAALNWLRLVYDRSRPPGSRQVFAGFALDNTAGSPSRGDDWLGGGLPDAHRLAESRGGSYLRYTVLTTATVLCDWADDEFARDTAESRSRARALYSDAASVLADPVLASGVPATNPELAVLRSRSASGLAKLRSGLNIAGMVRPLSPIDGGGGGAAVPPPTTYRYSALVNRAQQLLAAATQVEDRYLASLEKRDAESYNLLLAGQDLAVAATRVTIAREQAAIATSEIGLAEQQVARATTQSDTYRQWISAGPNRFERDMLSDYRSAQNYRQWAADAQSASSFLSGIGGLLTGIATGGLGIVAGIASLAGGIAGADASQLSASAENAMTDASIAGTQASWERRQQEWSLQKALSDIDVQTGKQQVAIATDRAAVAADEAAAAALGQANAQAKLDFLSSKFTNAQLYAWMSGVLGGVYRQLLQQATAVARLAEQQLAFERQAAPTGYVKADYWSPASAAAAAGSTGLTGSSRLLADLTQLEQYAFETNRRKLQLTQTFSLAALSPVDLERFRATGVLPFAIPLDRWGAPGTYLATIRRVRVSIAALVPSDAGIRGTLTGGGTSHIVVADGGGYRLETLSRAPEAVVVTTPAGASGVFEVDLTPELLLPWEGCGLDLGFELRLPKALNAFDYRTIADVQLAVDFTAFFSADYAATVTRSQPTTRTQTVALRLRDDMDAWYALVTAAQQLRDGTAGGTPPPLLARWLIRDADIAVNAMPPLAIENVVVMVVRSAGGPSALTFQHLTVDGQPAAGSTAATTVNDLVSTRSGSGSNWAALRTLDPVGTWELAVAPDPQVVAALAAGDVDDIVLVVDYRAGVPA